LSFLFLQRAETPNLNKKNKETVGVALIRLPSRENVDNGGSNFVTDGVMYSDPNTPWILLVHPN
jgi:hypothetical protein